MSQQIHVIPVGKPEPIHLAGVGCWCSPLKKDLGYYIHHAKDGREKWERQGITQQDKGWVLVYALEKPAVPPLAACPHCGCGLRFSDDRGPHCDGCDKFDPETDLREASAEQKSKTLAMLEFMGCMAASPTLLHVLQFALRMEAKLAKNRRKGDREGWLKDHPWELVERILDETVEVQQSFTAHADGIDSPDPEKTANECADVANFCMMVADSVLHHVRPSRNPQD